MIQNVLSSIEGIGLIPSIAFVSFFTFFIVIVFLAIKMDRGTEKEISEIPLNDK
jgi:hypothetical protein